MQDEGMESAPRTQPAPEPPPPPEAAPGHRFPCIWTGRDLGKDTFGIGWNERRNPSYFATNTKSRYIISNMYEI